MNFYVILWGLRWAGLLGVVCGRRPAAGDLAPDYVESSAINEARAGYMMHVAYFRAYLYGPRALSYSGASIFSKGAL